MNWRVNLEKVLGTENPADLMTKHLDQRSIEKCLDKMGVVFLEGRAKTAPMLIKNDPVAMEVQQLNEKIDKTCVIYDDDLEALRLLAARAAPRLNTAAPLPLALQPQEYVPRSQEPLPQSWADIMEKSDGRRNPEWQRHCSHRLFSYRILL